MDVASHKKTKNYLIYMPHVTSFNILEYLEYTAFQDPIDLHAAMFEHESTNDTTAINTTGELFEERQKRKMAISLISQRGLPHLIDNLYDYTDYLYASFLYNDSTVFDVENDKDSTNSAEEDSFDVLDDSYIQDLIHKHSDLEDTFFDEYADDIVDQSFYHDSNFLSEQLNYDEEEFEHVDTNNDFLLNSYYAFLSQRIKMPMTDVHYDLFDISDERIF